MMFAEDTRPETREVLLQLWRKKSPADRLIHGFRLSQSVRERVKESIRAENPQIEPIDLLIQTFRRIYRHDLSLQELERMCARIREYHRTKMFGNF